MRPSQEHGKPPYQTDPEHPVYPSEPEIPQLPDGPEVIPPSVPEKPDVPPAPHAGNKNGSDALPDRGIDDQDTKQSLDDQQGPHFAGEVVDSEDVDEDPDVDEKNHEAGAWKWNTRDDEMRELIIEPSTRRPH